MGTCASTLRFFVAVDRGAWDPTTQLRNPYRVNFIVVRELIAPASANTALPLLLVWRASYVFACASILVGCLRLASFFFTHFPKSEEECFDERWGNRPRRYPLSANFPAFALRAAVASSTRCWILCVFSRLRIGLPPFFASPEVCGLLRLFDWRPTGVCV